MTREANRQKGKPKSSKMRKKNIFFYSVRTWAVVEVEGKQYIYLTVVM